MMLAWMMMKKPSCLISQVDKEYHFHDGRVSKVGGKLNREIVSVRSCVRTRGLVVRWDLEKIELPVAFPFSLLAQDGISFEFCMVLVNPGEI